MVIILCLPIVDVILLVVMQTPKLLLIGTKSIVKNNMLNQSLVNSLPPEYRLLYESRIRITDRQLLDKLRNLVRKLRAQNRRNSQDSLVAKQDKYGNQGGWYYTLAKSRLKSYKVFYAATNIPCTSACAFCKGKTKLFLA